MFKLPMYLFVCALCAPASATEPTETLPIREITAFKDGHSLVLRSGKASVNEDGDVVLAELPRPIMGTFWAEENEHSSRLASITVDSSANTTIRPAATTEELLSANVGRTIAFRSGGDSELRSGVLIDVIDHRLQSQQPSPIWNGYSWVPQPQAISASQRIALIQFENDIAALPLSQMSDIRFIGSPPMLDFEVQTDQERMTLDLDWSGTPEDTADVSLMYIQRGLRWIPSYRITMLDGDRVNIELQATLINELADLDSVKMHLAIGVPQFAFEHTPDPMALRESFDSLGLFFQRAGNGQTGAMLSNAIMSQSMRMSEVRRDNGGNAGNNQPPAPELTGSERAEDLYVFTLDNISLQRGARMVVPLVSYEVSAESVYRLDLPASPPVQALQHFNNDQHRKLAQLLNRPIAKHLLRIDNSNTNNFPITTAPALVVKNGRTLAQGMLTYAAPGATVDLEVGAAVDIAVNTDERETGREPNAVNWDGYSYTDIGVSFQAELTNRKPHAVTLEVRKLAFGLPASVGQDGEAIALSVFGHDAFDLPSGIAWWHWYNWPYYWHRLNGASRFTWTVKLDAGETSELDASWKYYWR